MLISNDSPNQLNGLKSLELLLISLFIRRLSLLLATLYIRFLHGCIPENYCDASSLLPDHLPASHISRSKSLFTIFHVPEG